MKKYLLSHVLFILGYLAIILTKGISWGITLYEHDSRPYAMDGAYVLLELLIINLLYAVFTLLISFVMTASKKITLKYKWIFPIILLVFALFIPATKYTQLGGFAGRNIYRYRTLVEPIQRGFQ